MLIQLSVQDFALIDRIDIELDAKLNILTGETGAGKSIIIDAVSLLLGARAHSEFIREGKEKSIIEGTFIIPHEHPLEKKLNEYGYELDVDRLLILTREISRTGKNICRVNNRIVTLGVFKEIGNQLINIYGQHDFQALSNSEQHSFLLDNMGNEKFENLLKKVGQTYSEWRKYENEVNKLREQLKNKEQRLDLLRFQIDEIEKMNLVEDEEEEINKELAVLNNWERIISKTKESYELLYGNNSAYDQISYVVNNIGEIEEFDPQLAEISNNLETVVYQIEDCARALANYGEDYNFDPDRKEYLQERKYALDKLKKKYGGSIKEIISLKKEMEEELYELENSEFQIEKIQAKVKEWEQKYLELALELSDLRKKYAAKLEKNITQQLVDLSMPHTKFKVKFTKTENTLRGIDKIEFLISPNPGEPLKPLAKIASGGEMSRIMLAFKVILADSDTITTLIFDEIDSGIGGHVVRNVGDKLYQVANTHQVICITHSPHIASLASKHFKITKKINKNKTSTQLTVLDESGRIAELARMLGNNDQVTFGHAQELRNKALYK